MGKKVFEIAKDLGVSHNVVLDKCRSLQIEARNYMAVLTNEQEARVMAAFRPQSGASVEAIGPGAGVMRRRRSPEAPSAQAAAEASAAPTRPVGADSIQEALTGPRPPKAAEVKSAAPKAQPEPSSDSGAKVLSRPATPAAAEPAQESAPKTRAPKAASEGAATAQPVSPTQPAQRPSATQAKVLSRGAPPERPTPTQARVISRPAPVTRKEVPPARPAAPTKPRKVGDATLRGDLKPVTSMMPRRPLAEEAPPEVVEEKPAVEEKSAAVAKPRGPERVAAPQKPAERAGVQTRSPSGVSKREPAERPKREQIAPSVVRRTVEPPSEVSTQLRVPKARPKTPETVTAAAAQPSGAKILGSIPLEQLRARTRPMARRPGPPGRGAPGAGPGGPAGPRGPRPPYGAGPARGPAGAPGARGVIPDFQGAPAVGPPADRGEPRRRRGRVGGGAEEDQRSRRAGAGAGAAAGRVGRRKEFGRDELYRGTGPGAMRPGRGRKRKLASRRGAKTQLTTPAAHKRVVRVDGTISLGELAKQLGTKVQELIRKLMDMGVMATINQQLDLDTATLIAVDYDYEVKNVAFDELALLSGPISNEAPADSTEEEEDPNLELRAPVVTIMGHVDHGKTTLLDSIRSANVAKGESGGITQHIGAYRVETRHGPVVFLDTPGHAAFTAMRARGTSLTDIVVLVVAADDGIMPQTVESINHARAAGVPIVVAVNKMDKHGADVSRITQELTQYNIVSEAWGGEHAVMPISALKGTGVADLLEHLALQAEMLELKASKKKDAYGRVIEGRVDKGRGNVVTVLVQEGTLKVGDYMVAGAHFGRVRALMDYHGKRIKVAGPSTPVEILGLNGLPRAGDAFYTAKSEKDAKKVAEFREAQQRQAITAKQGALSGADLLAQMDKVERKTQNIILKTDVSGTLEALLLSLEQLATEEVEANVVHAAVGAISESDIDLAVATDAVVLGFNVSADSKAKRRAEHEKITVSTFSVIYNLLDTAKDLLSGLLAPETVQEELGAAEVRAVFHVQRVGSIAGSYVTHGKVVRNAMGRVRRGSEIMHVGKISTLKRFKDDVREVALGFECGLSIDGYKDVQVGDIIEVFEERQVQRKLDD